MSRREGPRLGFARPSERRTEPQGFPGPGAALQRARGAAEREDAEGTPVPAGPLSSKSREGRLSSRNQKSAGRAKEPRRVSR